ncbi:MAG TPA: VOC family protein [Thermoanaerobaculia bacterium]|nr:VOC family protein [Thermoanaerobaculia bacterium]
MLFGISHLWLESDDLEAALQFYCDTLGFQVLEQSDDYVDLDAAGVKLRLSRRGSEPAPRIRLQTGQLEQALPLLETGGASLVASRIDLERRQKELEVRVPDGSLVVLWRRLREDELPEPPELPITRAWDAAAVTLAQSLLVRVPEPFRELARSGTVAEAELLGADFESISTQLVARASVRATPRMMRARLQPVLVEHGFDPADFADDFAC